MIATLVAFGGSTPLPRLAVLLAWGSVAGSALQFARAAAGRRARRARPAPRTRSGVGSRPRRSSRNFVPVFVSRGVVQISAYVDTLLASLLPTGAVTGLANAQLLYTLPVSLFGMSVAAAELPAMAGGARGRRPGTRGAPRAAECRPAADRVLRRAVRDGVSGAWRRDRRGAAPDRPLPATTTRCMSGAFWPARRVGLLASTLGRLYSSTYYALRDTRTPLGFAIVRIGADDGARLLSSRFRCAGALGRAATLGRRRADGIGGPRRDGSKCCCCAARSNARIGPHRTAGAVTSRHCGCSASSRPPSAWGVRRWCIPPMHPAIVAALVSRTRMASSISGRHDRCVAFPRRRAPCSRVRRGGD